MEKPVKVPKEEFEAVIGALLNDTPDPKDRYTVTFRLPQSTFWERGEKR